VRLQTHSFGDYTFHPHAVFPSAAAAAAGPAGNDNPGGGGGSSSSSSSSNSGSSTGAPRHWDFVVVTTKALPDRGDDSAAVAPLVGPATALVLIQNGVGVEHPYRRRFPAAPLVSAVTVVSAEQPRPGLVVQNRWTRIHLGPYTHSAAAASSPPPPAAPTAADDDALAARGEAAAQALTTALRAGGVRDAEALHESALQTVRWHKLTINAAFNPTAVLCGGRGSAAMARDPALRAHLAGVMGEIAVGAAAVLGRPFPSDLAGPERILASSARNEGGRPSMLLDWEAGRPLEIEVILGNPVRLAAARGVEMPRLQAMYALLKSMQALREEGEAAGRGKL